MTVFETDSYSYIKKRENVLILLLYFYFTLLLFSSPHNLDYSLLQCGYSAVIKNPSLGFDTIPRLCARVVESVKVECRNVTSILLHPKVSKDNKMCRVKTGRKKSGIVQRQ